MKIFVVAHKKVNKVKMKDYFYIGVGNNKAPIDADYNDSDGDNIAEKNNSFCELTAQYYIYKNIEDDYVGLVHYRRFFYHPIKSLFRLSLYSSSQLEKILGKYDVIVAKKEKIKKIWDKAWGVKNVYDFYCKRHKKRDIDALISVISEKFSDYKDTLMKVLYGQEFYPFNMIVCKKEIFNEYSSFLFDVLFTLEKEIDISSYNQYDSRVFGFLSERLLIVYLLKNNLRVKELPTIQTDVNRYKQILSDFNVKKFR